MAQTDMPVHVKSTSTYSTRREEEIYKNIPTVILVLWTVFSSFSQ